MRRGGSLRSHQHELEAGCGQLASERCTYIFGTTDDQGPYFSRFMDASTSRVSESFSESGQTPRDLLAALARLYATDSGGKLGIQTCEFDDTGG